MKILWITNTIFPEVYDIISGTNESKVSGGWMIAAAQALLQDSNIELAIATVYHNTIKLKRIKGERALYYLIPYGKGNIKYNKTYEQYWKRIQQEFCPDIIHIHGTEYTHGLSYIKACGSDKVVVSIQGLKSEIAKYYCAGLTPKDIFPNLTIHDFLKGGINSEKRKCICSGKYEKDLLRSVKHVIGRTYWDYAHVKTINPDLHYHFCNETLRNAFYDGSIWSYKKCVPHSIFISQASYPLKGFHFILKAMPLILKRFPDTTIRVAGEDHSRMGRIWKLKHYTTYWKILDSLIKKYNLKNKIKYLGNLNAEEMKQEYLRANVFVCPSSIENSPNSLCEAQVLGVPVISSYVGGVPSLMRFKENYLYRYDDFEQLSQLIIEQFNVKKFEDINIASYLNRHSIINNKIRLTCIYNEILQ